MLFDVLFKGVLMGFAVAAPVGPIGVLCIRRTLSDGRAAGLATGLGRRNGGRVLWLAGCRGLCCDGYFGQLCNADGHRRWSVADVVGRDVGAWLS